MRARTLLLLPLLAILAACSKGEEEIKQLYPKKVVIGPTTHEFHYDQGRVYSVTTNRPNFYEEVTYSYFDDYFKEPDHQFKDKIFEVNFRPDAGPIGWDKNDSIMFRKEQMTRSEAGLLARESQTTFMRHSNIRDYVYHAYDTLNQLTESKYYFYNPADWNTSTVLDDPKYISKVITYSYEQGKLTKVTYSAPSAQKPYLTIELEYDDKPGYLRSLPLEVRFMPLELPYRNHNITRYTVLDREGNIRKDLSYTCRYSYNHDGYPTKIKKTMLDGLEQEGYIVYKASIGKAAVASLEPEK
ncbi:hypothetical protein [Pontibacter amylolyticus]|uniref:DUF4595 domain-containing protein n=1 Tax=Pontibacter amylolyticus TaxID=1424080 RepID=A0ABQ1WE06_9BACT|nr:hypothetical protein [Pontibacter amylolyticus]GGG24433.1 hypothetical protein GCM10011323_30260 [Pontibacter amylolyticus]